MGLSFPHPIESCGNIGAMPSNMTVTGFNSNDAPLQERTDAAEYRVLGGVCGYLGELSPF